jgi:hypothetical protein
MRYSLFGLCLLLGALSACTAKVPLSLKDKAAYTVELIAVRPECARFAQRLKEPDVTEKLIEETYRAAQSAFCVKPDV